MSNTATTVDGRPGRLLEYSATQNGDHVWVLEAVTIRDKQTFFIGYVAPTELADADRAVFASFLSTVDLGPAKPAGSKSSESGTAFDGSGNLNTSPSPGRCDDRSPQKDKRCVGRRRGRGWRLNRSDRRRLRPHAVPARPGSASGPRKTTTPARRRLLTRRSRRQATLTRDSVLPRATGTGRARRMAAVGQSASRRPTTGRIRSSQSRYWAPDGWRPSAATKDGSSAAAAEIAKMLTKAIRRRAGKRRHGRVHLEDRSPLLRGIAEVGARRHHGVIGDGDRHDSRRREPAEKRVQDRRDVRRVCRTGTRCTTSLTPISSETNSGSSRSSAGNSSRIRSSVV